MNGCYTYFENNNWYKSWFNPIEQMVLNPIGFDYFENEFSRACHRYRPVGNRSSLGEVSKESKEFLVDCDRDFLAKQLETHKFKFVLLNGDSAIKGANNTEVVKCETIYEGSFEGLVKYYKIVCGIGLSGSLFFGWSEFYKHFRGPSISKALFNRRDRG